MTRSELINLIALKFPQLQREDVDLSVKAVMGAMTHTLSHQGRIEIRGFGSFSIKRRPARVGRNPKTGDKVKIAEKNVPHFKVGKDLMRRIVTDSSGQ